MLSMPGVKFLQQPSFHWFYNAIGAPVQLLWPQGVLAKAQRCKPWQAWPCAL